MTDPCRTASASCAGRKSVSQEALAKACGVTRQTVNAIENNKYDPTLALAFALARELGTTVDALFTPCPPA